MRPRPHFVSTYGKSSTSPRRSHFCRSSSPEFPVSEDCARRVASIRRTFSRVVSRELAVEVDQIGDQPDQERYEANHDAGAGAPQDERLDVAVSMTLGPEVEKRAMGIMSNSPTSPPIRVKVLSGLYIE